MPKKRIVIHPNHPQRPGPLRRLRRLPALWGQVEPRDGPYDVVRARGRVFPPVRVLLGQAVARGTRAVLPAAGVRQME